MDIPRFSLSVYQLMWNVLWLLFKKAPRNGG